MGLVAAIPNRAAISRSKVTKSGDIAVLIPTGVCGDAMKKSIGTIVLIEDFNSSINVLICAHAGRNECVAAFGRDHFQERKVS